MKSKYIIYRIKHGSDVEEPLLVDIGGLEEAEEKLNQMVEKITDEEPWVLYEYGYYVGFYDTLKPA